MLDHSEEKMFNRYVIISHGLRFIFSGYQNVVKFLRYIRTSSLYFGVPFNYLLNCSCK